MFLGKHLNYNMYMYKSIRPEYLNESIYQKEAIT